MAVIPTLTGDSVELVAFELLRETAHNLLNPTKDQILDLYAECLLAAQGKRAIGSDFDRAMTTLDGQD